MRCALLLVAIAACAPANPATCSPIERCGDGTDNDCDGEIDEGCDCTPGTIQLCGDGVCAGQQLCESGTWSACYGGEPSAEICDGIDNDCDGAIDNGDNACGGICELEGAPGDPCDGPDGDLCREGTWSCASINQVACSDQTGTKVELCGDGIDNNCDGRADEYCAAQRLRWSDHGGSTVLGAHARAMDVTVASDGSVYVVGSHDRAVPFGSGTVTWDAGSRSDGFVVKYSTAGELVWHRSIEGAGDAAATAIAIAPDGSVIVAGSFGLGGATAQFASTITRTAIGGNDAFVARYSPAGEVLAATSFGSDNDDEITDVAVGPAGQVAITGKFVGGSLQLGAFAIPHQGFNWAPFVAELDASLAPVWAKRIELVAPATGDLEGDAVAFDAGSVLVGGTVKCYQSCAAPQLAVDRGGATEKVIAVSASMRGGFLVRIDATGAVLAAVGTPQVGGIAVAGGDVYITGAFSGIEPLAVGTPAQTTLVARGQADIWLGRLSPTLELAWAKQFGSATSCGGFGVASDDAGLALALDGTIPVVAGTHMLALELAPDLSLSGDGWGNVFWAGFDAAGALAWGHNGRIGEQACSGGGSAHGVAVAPNGDVVVVGDFTAHVIFPTATLTGTNDFFVAAFQR